MTMLFYSNSKWLYLYCFKLIFYFSIQIFTNKQRGYYSYAEHNRCGYGWFFSAYCCKRLTHRALMEAASALNSIGIQSSGQLNSQFCRSATEKAIMAAAAPSRKRGRRRTKQEQNTAANSEGINAKSIQAQISTRISLISLELSKLVCINGSSLLARQ